MSNEINIESLLERLRAVSETGCDPDLPHEAADALEALAQRAEDAEQLATARGHTIQGLRYELAEVKVERDTLAPEVQQAGPVRLTEAEIGQIDRQSREGIKSLMSTWPVPLARAIEDAVLERNGLKPQAKGD